MQLLFPVNYCNNTVFLKIVEKNIPYLNTLVLNYKTA